MKLAISTILAASAAAFAPSSQVVRSSDLSASLNGWTPDENAFAWGLPGSLDPAPEFDPFGFAKGTGELVSSTTSLVQFICKPYHNKMLLRPPDHEEVA